MLAYRRWCDNRFAHNVLGGAIGAGVGIESNPTRLMQIGPFAHMPSDVRASKILCFWRLWGSQNFIASKTANFFELAVFSFLIEVQKDSF